MTIGDRLRLCRKEEQKTLDEVAAVVGISRQTMSRYETGIIGNIPSDKIELLAKALNVSPAYLMGWEDKDGNVLNFLDNVDTMTTRRVPRLGVIACGEPILAQQNIEEYDSVPDFVKCDFTLVCKGDSMTGARINDGDIVCIRQQPIVENGQIAAVLIDGEFDNYATLKRVSFQGDAIILMPENSKYTPMVYTGEDKSKVRILGLATHFISKVV